MSQLALSASFELSTAIVNVKLFHESILDVRVWRQYIRQIQTSNVEPRAKSQDFQFKFLELAVGRYPIKFILPEFVSYLGEQGVMCHVCGKRLTFLYTSPYEYVEYNVWGP